jgi:hypothetical protein
MTFIQLTQKSVDEKRNDKAAIRKSGACQLEREQYPHRPIQPHRREKFVLKADSLSLFVAKVAEPEESADQVVHEIKPKQDSEASAKAWIPNSLGNERLSSSGVAKG